MPKHRLFILVITLVWSVHPVFAGSGTSKRKGQAMTQRILYHKAPTAEFVKNLKVDILGQLPQGAWMATDDATALELLKRDKSTAMVYPSREKYDQAMEGLTPDQMAKAMALRLELWTARAKDEVLPYLYEVEVAYLTKLAVASADPKFNSKNLTKDLIDFYNLEFEILDLTLFESRYKQWTPAALIEATFESLNPLNQDLESLTKRFGAATPVTKTEVLASRQKLALTLDSGLHKYGLKQGANPTGKVHASLLRGVYLTPFDAMRFQGIKESHEPIQEWSKGFVTAWEDWDLKSLESKGGKAQILYLNGSELLRGFMSLTAPQLENRFSKRLKPTSTADLAQYLASRQIVLALIEGRVGPALEKSDLAISQEIIAHLKLEKEELRSNLILANTLKVHPSSNGPTLLDQGEADFSEISFWVNWSQANHWDIALAELEKIQPAKRKFLDQLKLALIP
jgi:hypothetical protein